MCKSCFFVALNIWQVKVTGKKMGEEIDDFEIVEPIICEHMRETLLRHYSQQAAAEDNNRGNDDLGDLEGIANMARRAGENAPRVANAGLNAAGFGNAGIRAGSWAAGRQAAAGAVRRGSTFSRVQSFGAKGGAGLGFAAAATTVTALIGAGIYLWKQSRENAAREERIRTIAEQRLMERELELQAEGRTLICNECRRAREEQRRRRMRGH